MLPLRRSKLAPPDCWNCIGLALHATTDEDHPSVSENTLQTLPHDNPPHSMMRLILLCSIACVVPIPGSTQQAQQHVQLRIGLITAAEAAAPAINAGTSHRPHPSRGVDSIAGSSWYNMGVEAHATRSASSYQMRTRCSGVRYSFCPGFTSNAEYQGSMLRTTSVRTRHGECGLVSSCWRSAASRSLQRHTCAQPR